MRRILVGSVVNQDPEVWKSCLTTLAAQPHEGIKLDACFAFDPSSPNAQECVSLALGSLPGARTYFADPKPSDAAYSVNATTHEWTVPTFYWLAREKQRLIDLARNEGYDALLLVDSDLLLGTGTLRSLLAADKDVVSAVFWTRWTPDAPPLPQVWLSHPYEFQGRGMEAHEFMRKLADRELVRVGGLGACTLIQKRVLDRVAFWPLVEGLPTWRMWQGEDRHFCVTAERNHVELWADAWPDVWHCYRPEYRAQLADRFNALTDAPYLDATGGQLVSLTLEPCEEPALALHREHVRGRLGMLRLLPEIEAAVRSLQVGESRFVKVRFPLWYDLAPYRGQVRLVRVTLQDAKPFSLPPTLDEWHSTPEAIAESFMVDAPAPAPPVPVL